MPSSTLSDMAYDDVVEGAHPTQPYGSSYPNNNHNEPGSEEYHQQPIGQYSSSDENAKCKPAAPKRHAAFPAKKLTL